MLKASLLKYGKRGMLMSFIHKRFPLALRSDRERTEQMVRIAFKSNAERDLEDFFRTCHVDAAAEKKIFDEIHDQYGEKLLSSFFSRDMELSRKVMGEALMKLMLQCEITSWSAPI